MPADRFLEIRRDPHSDEVLARGGAPEAQSILQHSGFVSVVRVHEIYHRAPAGLSPDDEIQLAADAVARLRSAGYHVTCDAEFDADHRPVQYRPLGGSVLDFAEQIRLATTTDEVAGVITELTAPHDGVLTALNEVLRDLADFCDGLGEAADPATAGRLRYLADEYMRIIHTDLEHTRTELADRHAPHPGRRACTAEVPADERERSATCACPPPPRPLPAPAPRPPASGPRR
ncbi:hypothetical protein ACWEL8_09660 [Streptomyces sp. NPDC004690]